MPSEKEIAVIARLKALGKDPSERLTMDQIAREGGTHIQTVRKWSAAGQIPWDGKSQRPRTIQRWRWELANDRRAESMRLR